ncbi:hypothetical protein DPMN_073583 [Dreissena polymorpha]|uniref:Uncharacterized protein n=1 Tax=Dreissena polymorpha TaxID=45954 RepID=A0A9D4BZA1_DREPO|nr:hypothetical protein DPMN_073583 [Dreissena polymorpha]
MLLFGWLDPGFNDRSVVVRQRRAALKRQKAKDVIHEKLSDAKEDLKHIKSNGYTHELQKCTGVCTSARDPRHDAETDSYTSNTKRCSGKALQREIRNVSKTLKAIVRQVMNLAKTI